MSRRIFDLRPVATHGWTVAVANVIDDSGEIERETVALVGWAICRESVDGELDALPVVLPCWYQGADLIVSPDVDAFEVVAPGFEPDWREIKSEALISMRVRYARKKAHDGR